MDNIQKLVFGVLGVAGMIAMLVPSPESMGAGGQAQPPQSAEVPPAAPSNEDQAPDDMNGDPQESELSDDEAFRIGEPTIDGNPIQGEFDNSSNAPPPPPIDYQLPNMQMPNMPMPNVPMPNVPMPNYGVGGVQPYGPQPVLPPPSVG